MNSKGKIGVLMVNLGTPDSPGRYDVYRYLKQFLLDKRVIDIPWIFRQFLVRGFIAPFRSGSSSKLYKKLWTENGSPLLYYGERLVEGLREQLGEDDYVVELAMRYQNPSIDSALEKLNKQNIRELIVFPLFPHYASASTGSVHEEVMRLVGKQLAIPNIKMINSFYDNEDMVDVFVKNARQFDLDSYDHIIFSYHGLPQSQLKKTDNCNHCLKVEGCCNAITEKNQFCYSAQCHATSFLIADKLNLDRAKYTISYQSRLGPDPWVQPYTIKVLEELANKGAKRLLVFSPAFVSDCLETIIEITDEYQEEFEEFGGEHIDLVPSLNDDPDWISGVVKMIKDESKSKVTA
jgi:ferrochelatase